METAIRFVTDNFFWLVFANIIAVILGFVNDVMGVRSMLFGREGHSTRPENASSLGNLRRAAWGSAGIATGVAAAELLAHHGETTEQFADVASDFFENGVNAESIDSRSTKEGLDDLFDIFDPT